jgi:hypothetical protein
VAGKEEVIVMTVAKLLGAVAALSLALVVVPLAMGVAPDDRAGPHGTGAFVVPATAVLGPTRGDDPADRPATAGTAVTAETHRGVTSDELVLVAGVAALVAALTVGLVAMVTHTHHGGGTPTPAH